MGMSQPDIFIFNLKNKQKTPQKNKQKTGISFYFSEAFLQLRLSSS